MRKGLSRRTGLQVAGLALLLSQLSPGQVAADTVRVADKPPPAEVAAALAQTLRPPAIQVLSGDRPIFEFWWRSEVPLKAGPESPAKALEAVAERTFLGVVAIAAGHRDYKDNEIAAGLYTMRQSLLPSDGDHMGTADYPYFAVLIPAVRDTALDGFASTRSMLRASSKDTPTEHPLVLSLRPAAGDESALPRLVEPAAEHQAVRLQLQTRPPGSAQPVPVLFEVVYKGKGKM